MYFKPIQKGVVHEVHHAFFNPFLWSHFVTHLGTPKVCHTLELENPNDAQIQYALLNFMSSARSTYSI